MASDQLPPLPICTQLFQFKSKNYEKILNEGRERSSCAIPTPSRIWHCSEYPCWNGLWSYTNQPSKQLRLHPVQLRWSNSETCWSADKGYVQIFDTNIYFAQSSRTSICKWNSVKFLFSYTVLKMFLSMPDTQNTSWSKWISVTKSI